MEHSPMRSVLIDYSLKIPFYLSFLLLEKDIFNLNYLFLFFLCNNHLCLAIFNYFVNLIINIYLKKRIFLYNIMIILFKKNNISIKEYIHEINKVKLFSLIFRVHKDILIEIINA